MSFFTRERAEMGKSAEVRMDGKSTMWSAASLPLGGAARIAISQAMSM